MRRLVVGFAVAASLLAFGAGGVGADSGDFGFNKSDLHSVVLPVSVRTTASGMSGSATGKGKPPRVGPNVRINAAQTSFPNGLLGRSETSIATSPDGSLLVGGFNDAQGFCGPPFGAACTPPAMPGLSGFSYSMDGGSNWTDSGPPPSFGTDIFTRGDPWLDRGGANGSTYYYANLAVSYPGGEDRGVSVHRGHFTSNGFVWDDVRSFTHPNPSDSYDKEALAAAKDGSGAVYVSVTNFIGECGQPAFGFGRIEVWRSHDSGASWQGPAVVSQDQTAVTDPNNPICGLTGTLQQGSTPAIGPNGAVYVVWNDGPNFGLTSIDSANQVMLSKSSDGGATWSTPTAIASGFSTFSDPPVGYNRGYLLTQPRIAIASSGPYRGRIYVTYSAARSAVPYNPNGQNLQSIASYLVFSDNGGATWSTPQELGGTPVPATGVKRIWPTVTVEPSGIVDVVYQESQEQPATDGSACSLPFISTGGTRTGPDHSFVTTFWTQSTDGGASFAAPIALSTVSSDWCTANTNFYPNFGDYIGSASAGNRVLALWADGRNLVPDSFFATGFGH